jgi:ketosteroid isomerase-like protein
MFGRSSLLAFILAIGLAAPSFADTSEQDFLKWLQSSMAEADAAVNRHDAAKVLSYYSDNAVRITPTTIQSGRAEIEKGIAAYMKLNPRDSVTKIEQSHVSGDQAWAAGPWSLTLSVPGNDALRQKGFWAIVYDRDGDAWKVRLEIFNTTPAPPPKQQ